MNRLNRVLPVVAREELEDFWRLKLEEANERLQLATARCSNALEKTPKALVPGEYALTQARQARSEAQAEYARLLRIFTELTVHGKIPEDLSATGADGGKP